MASLIMQKIREDSFYSCVVLFNSKRKEVLLQKRDSKAPVNPNIWSFFGGGSEKGENPEDCLCREIKEEIGVSVDRNKLKFFRSYVNQDMLSLRHVFFLDFDLKKEEMTLGEGEDFDWIPLDRVFDLELTKYTRVDLEFFVSKIKMTKSVGGVVINKKGEVVVVNQNGNSWSLPKGHVESGETELETAIREIREETGLTQMNLLEDLGRYERYKISLDGGDDITERKEIQMFLFETEEEHLLPEDASNPEARWVKTEEVSHILTHPKDKEFFLSVLPKIEKMKNEKSSK